MELVNNAENSSYRKSTRVSAKPGNAIILHRSTVARVVRVRVSEWQIAPSTAVGPLGQLGQHALKPVVSRWKPAGGPARIQRLHSVGAFASGMITMILCASICHPVLPQLKPLRLLRMVSGRPGALGTRARGRATAVSIPNYFHNCGNILNNAKATEYFKNIWRISSIRFAILDACAVWDNTETQYSMLS